MKVKSLSVFLLLYIAIFLYAPSAWAATVTNQQCASEITWHTGAGTLASNAQVQTNTVNQGACAGYRHAYCTFNMPSGAATAIAAGGTIIVWARVTTDTAGTVFPDGGVGVTPLEAPLMQFPLSPGTGAQIVSAHVKDLPMGVFRGVIRADNTSGTINNTTPWTLKCRPYTEQIN